MVVNINVLSAVEAEVADDLLWDQVVCNTNVNFGSESNPFVVVPAPNPELFQFDPDNYDQDDPGNTYVLGTTFVVMIYTNFTGTPAVFLEQDDRLPHFSVVAEDTQLSLQITGTCVAHMAMSCV